jgi:aspartate 1-decarboxylase
MLVKLLKSKLHNATITAAKLHYQGSLAVDRSLMDAAGLLLYEAVIVADITTGSRVQTYVIPAPARSGKIEVLGAAARLVNPNDTVIILNFAFYTPEEAKKHKPKVLILGDKNKIIKSADNKKTLKTRKAWKSKNA